MFLSETIQYNLNYLNIMNYRIAIICNVIHDNADETILTSIALFLSETIQYNLNYLNIMNYRVVIICNVIHENADDTILTSIACFYPKQYSITSII